MKNKFKIDGLWIPYQILTDKKLRDKEKDFEYNKYITREKIYTYCSSKQK